MTREQFKKILDTIKKHHDLTNSFCDVLEQMSPGCYCDAFIYSEYEELIINDIFSLFFNADQQEVIQYFMYDLEFGAKYTPQCYADQNGYIDLSSIEALMDYLKLETDEPSNCK